MLLFVAQSPFESRRGLDHAVGTLHAPSTSTHSFCIRQHIHFLLILASRFAIELFLWIRSTCRLQQSPAIKQRASHQITPHKKGIAVFPSSTTTISSLAYALFAYRLERLELDTSAQDKSKTPACGYNTHSFSKPADPTERRSTQ